MSIESKIFTTLTGLVGGRVFPDFAPEGTQLPYIVYQQVGGTAVSFLEKTVPDIRNGRFQVEVWAPTRNEAMTISQQAEAAMVQATTFNASPYNAYVAQVQEDINLYGALQDFSVWDSR